MNQEPINFAYQNLSGRPQSPMIAGLSRISRRMRSVQDQVVPYARAWGEANAAQLRGSGPLWIALGDSMAQGIGAARPDLGYIGQLASGWREQGHDFRLVNLSFSGARVRDVIDRQWPAALELIRDRSDVGAAPGTGRGGDGGMTDGTGGGAEGGMFGLVTVLIGSNDLLRTRYRQELPAAFAELFALLPAGSIVATLPNGRKAALALSAQADRAAAAGRVRVADLRPTGTAWPWRGKLAADLFHPNEHGYADLAEVFRRAAGPRPFPSFPSSPSIPSWGESGDDDAR